MAFAQLAEVGKQRGHVSSGWSWGKRTRSSLRTARVKSLKLDSSFHVEAHNRASELPVLAPGSHCLRRTATVFIKPPSCKSLSYSLLKTVTCVPKLLLEAEMLLVFLSTRNSLVGQFHGGKVPNHYNAWIKEERRH